MRNGRIIIKKLFVCLKTFFNCMGFMVLTNRMTANDELGNMWMKAAVA